MEVGQPKITGVTPSKQGMFTMPDSTFEDKGHDGKGIGQKMDKLNKQDFQPPDDYGSGTSMWKLVDKCDDMEEANE